MNLYKLKLYYSENILNNLMVFIPTLLLIMNSGFYIKGFFVVCPIYISFYLTIPIILYLLLTGHKFYVPRSCLICIFTIIYLFLTQITMEVRIWSILSAVCTMLFFVIGIILLQKITYKQAISISNCFLLYNFVLYLADSIYRFALFNFNLNNIFVNFYAMKDSCFIFGDTNYLAINTTTLGMFAFYLFNKTKQLKYIIYFILFFLSFIIIGRFPLSD